MGSKKQSAVKGLVSLKSLFLMVGMIFSFQLQTIAYAQNAKVYGPASPAPSLNVKSYAQWKAEKVQHITNRIAEIQRKQRTDVILLKHKDMQFLKESEAREMENLTMAQKLRVSDYLLTYVMSFAKYKDALKEAASLMSSSDVVEVMEAYAQSLEKKDTSSTPLTADLIGNFER